MAKCRSDGKPLAVIASKFNITVEEVCRAITRVEKYDRGVSLLKDNPANIEGLTLVGILPYLARLSLQENGITYLTDLEGVPSDTLLQLPNVRQGVVDQLLGLLDEYRQTHRGNPPSL